MPAAPSRAQARAWSRAVDHGGYAATPIGSRTKPTVDNVRFPSGYHATYTLFYTFDNYQNRQIRKVYGNPIAATVKPGEVFNFPHGSIILFESYSVQQEDAAGEPLLDAISRIRVSLMKAGRPGPHERPGHPPRARRWTIERRVRWRLPASPPRRRVAAAGRPVGF